jgi:hypothetical protein
MLEKANSEIQQLYVYIHNVSIKLDQALDHCNAETIKSFCQALRPRVVQIKDMAIWEANVRG